MRERADVLAHRVPAVVEVPQLGPLVARVPLAELVAQAQDPFLGPGLVLVAAAAAEDGVELVALDRVQQRDGLQRVAGAVGALGQLAGVDELLDGADDELKAQPLHRPVAELDDLGEVVPGVHVQHGNGTLPGQNALVARCSITTESLPPENSSAGFSNSATTSRMMWIASDSRVSRLESLAAASPRGLDTLARSSLARCAAFGESASRSSTDSSRSSLVVLMLIRVVRILSCRFLPSVRRGGHRRAPPCVCRAGSQWTGSPVKAAG